MNTLTKIRNVINVRNVINGRSVEAPCADRTHLGDFIRDTHHLTGTHLGCEHGVCGACTVFVDGNPVRSCITFAAASQAREIVTIEGYDSDPVMAQLREAFHRFHALQCGYCTPGMLATARDIVLRLPHADESRVRYELSGNLCRCTGYVGIVDAILSVLAARRAASGDGQIPQMPLTTAKESNAGDFVCFALNEASLPAAVVKPADAERELVADKKGWSRIESSFQVPYPAAEVWHFMGDLAVVASCLPGAVLTEQKGEEIAGYIAIKFGPMAAKFKGSARLVRDEALQKGILQGVGHDSLSNSTASGDIAYQVTPALSAAGQSKVTVDLQFSLQGPLAQFSRSGLVRDFVRRMIADFGKNVSRKMNPALSDDERNAVAKLNPVALFFGVLLEKIVRLFNKKTHD